MQRIINVENAIINTNGNRFSMNPYILR